MTYDTPIFESFKEVAYELLNETLPMFEVNGEIYEYRYNGYDDVIYTAKNSSLDHVIFYYYLKKPVKYQLRLSYTFSDVILDYDNWCAWNLELTNIKNAQPTITALLKLVADSVGNAHSLQSNYKIIIEMIKHLSRRFPLYQSDLNTLLAFVEKETAKS